MLVLTRRVGEEIVIDNQIAVAVLAVQGNKVRIGVKAPPRVRVDRQEVHERRAEFGPKPSPIDVSAVLARRMKSRGVLRAMPLPLAKTTSPMAADVPGGTCGGETCS